MQAFNFPHGYTCLSCKKQVQSVFAKTQEAVIEGRAICAECLADFERRNAEARAFINQARGANRE